MQSHNVHKRITKCNNTDLQRKVIDFRHDNLLPDVYLLQKGIKDNANRIDLRHQFSAEVYGFITC